MRTLQIGLDWFPERAGGLPKYYYDLINTAPSCGIKVRGLVAGSDRVFEDTKGIVRSFAPRDANLYYRLIKSRQYVSNLIQNFNPDLIVSHFSLYTLPSIDKFTSPMVVHFHGPWAFEGAVEGNDSLKQKVKLTLERAVIKRGRKFIVLSDAFKNILIDQFNINENEITIIPGCVDINHFNINLSRENAREKLGWPRDKKIIIAVRRLVRRMGLDNLIESAAKICSIYPDVIFYIAGRGSMEGELNKKIFENRLNNNVKLIGFIPDEDLPSAYRAADISIVPSTALEGFGLIAAESLSCGTPVLVSPVGGLPEVVRGLDNNLVLGGCSPEDIYFGLSSILSGNIEIPSEEACRMHAYKNFNWSSNIKSIKNVYESAIQT